MKWKQRAVNQPPNKLTFTDIYYKDDFIHIREVKTNDKKYYKLATLYDKFGNWLKSVLKYYSNNKVYKEIITRK